MPKNEKWRTVEGVVVALEIAAKVTGARVTRNAKVPYRNDPSRTRQVDVHIENPVGPRTISIGIEVKNEKDPLTVEIVEQVDAKLSVLEIDRKCIVSTSGYSANARADAITRGVELLTMEQLSSVAWWGGPLTMGFRSRQVELLTAQLNFKTEDVPRVRELLPEPPKLDTIVIVQSEGVALTVDKLAQAHAIEALGQEQAAAIPHGGLFKVVVKPSVPWRSMSIVGRPELDLPTPDEMIGFFRLHIVDTELESHAFELHGRQAISTTISFNEELIQFTMTGRPSEEGGVQDFDIVASRVPKKQTRVGTPKPEKPKQAKKSVKSVKPRTK